MLQYRRLMARWTSCSDEGDRIQSDALKLGTIVRLLHWHGLTRTAAAILLMSTVNCCSGASPVASTNSEQNAVLAKLEPNGSVKLEHGTAAPTARSVRVHR